MSKPKRPPYPDDEEDLVDEGPPATDVGRIEELLLDDDLDDHLEEDLDGDLDGEELLDGGLPGSMLDDESAWPDDPALHRLPSQPWDDVDEDDLDGSGGAPDSDGPADTERLVDEGGTPTAWLDDDGLGGDDEEDDLVASRAARVGPDAWGGQRILVGREEQAVLTELGGVRLPAILATGMAESALSIPLRRLDDGRAEIELGGKRLQLDPHGLRTRIQLGPCLVRVRLRLVEGAEPRLVLGWRALAGQVIVDPAAHDLLADGEGDDS